MSSIKRFEVESEEQWDKIVPQVPFIEFPGS